MRVTENGSAERCYINISAIRGRMVVLESQLASGKRVMKTSDDPQATNAILRFKSMLAANEQYSINVSDGQSAMETTSLVLDNFANMLGTMKELIVRATNGGMTTSDRVSIALNIDKLLDDALTMAGTKFNGKYLFSGTNSLEAPFTLAADRSSVTANPNGITGSVEVPIADNAKQAMNIDGQEAFQGTAIFDTIIRLRDSLSAGNTPLAADAQALDDAFSHVAAIGGKTGMIVNRFINNATFLDSQKIQLMSLLSIEQDTDVAEAITKLKSSEVMLNAALNTTATILQKSLLDFLR